MHQRTSAIPANVPTLRTSHMLQSKIETNLLFDQFLLHRIIKCCKIKVSCCMMMFKSYFENILLTSIDEEQCNMYNHIQSSHNQK